MMTENDVGVMAVTRCAQSPPATPAKKAPRENAMILVAANGTPRHSAAISFSRIASMVRPMDECFTFQHTTNVITTQR